MLIVDSHDSYRHKRDSHCGHDQSELMLAVGTVYSNIFLDCSL